MTTADRDTIRVSHDEVVALLSRDETRILVVTPVSDPMDVWPQRPVEIHRQENGSVRLYHAKPGLDVEWWTVVRTFESIAAFAADDFWRTREYLISKFYAPLLLAVEPK